MKNYNCIIVDDSHDAINLIIDHINKTPNLKLINSFTSPLNALEALKKEKTDILFLDIEMPDINGIEFIDILKLKWKNDIPKIVFTTGFMDYALDGYESGVADYLLKPVSYARFKKCIDRLTNEQEKPSEDNNKHDFCFIESEGKKIRTDFKDIVYIEGARNYIIIGLTTKRMIIYNSMQAMQNLLPVEVFIRTHKSHIININMIHSVKGNKIIIMYNEKEKHFPIGITYKENVFRTLKLK